MRAAGFDDGAWARIPVSANWELHGHGQPLYQNIAYPFHPAHYPAAPADNPTGCYRTGFEVTAVASSSSSARSIPRSTAG